ITWILSIVAFVSAKSKLFCDLACAHDYVPVCATNGQTLNCRGATFAHNGVCKADEQDPIVVDSSTEG
ncbi:unnamed protein product, partial [Leptidea sinapis]